MTGYLICEELAKEPMCRYQKTFMNVMTVRIIGKIREG